MNKAPSKATGPEAGMPDPSPEAPTAGQRLLAMNLNQALAQLKEGHMEADEMLATLDSFLRWAHSTATELLQTEAENDHAFKLMLARILMQLRTFFAEKGLEREFIARTEETLSKFSCAPPSARAISILQKIPGSRETTIKKSAVIQELEDEFIRTGILEPDETMNYEQNGLPPAVMDELYLMGERVERVSISPQLAAILLSGTHSTKSDTPASGLPFESTIVAPPGSQPTSQRRTKKKKANSGPPTLPPAKSATPPLLPETAPAKAAPHSPAKRPRRATPEAAAVIANTRRKHIAWSSRLQMPLLITGMMGAGAVIGGTISWLTKGKPETIIITRTIETEAKPDIRRMPRTTYHLAPNASLERYIRGICHTGPTILCKSLKEAQEKTTIEATDIENTDIRLKFAFLDELKTAILQSNSSEAIKKMALEYVEQQRRYLTRFATEKKWPNAAADNLLGGVQPEKTDD